MLDHPEGESALGEGDVQVRGEGQDAGQGEKPEPWIETPQGSFFFVNALLVAPALVVLFPLSLQLLAGLISDERAASPFLDTIPFVASKAIPFLGWFLVIPIWTTVKNLKMKGLLLPRIALGFFLLVHLCFLGYTILSWI